MRQFAILTVTLLLLTASVAGAQTPREKKVRNDRKKVEKKGFWIYNDLAKGIAKAKKTGKPLLVVIRCIPCEACAQLDASIVERDPKVRKLLDKFVCVRIVYANDLDLSLFQYDYDQSFAAFFLNADKTIYGRYGTRSHQRESHNDVSIEGFAKALEGTLALHREYPANKKILQARHGSAPLFKIPQQFPKLRDKYGTKLNYKGQVARSCIHCHQVGEAIRHYYRSQGKPIPEQVLFSYPNPKVVGLVMDPKEMATVKKVLDGSTAEKDCFKKGDQIVTLENQPLLSTADIQWVLHNAPKTGTLKAKVLRGGKEIALTLTLDKGWRQRDDISWRATSWSLRRMATGGMRLEDVPVALRKKYKLPADALALRVKHVGQYGAHAAAKRAGFRQGDIIISLDGKTQPMRESDFLAYAVNHYRPGQRVPVTVLRNGRRMQLMLPMQE